MSNQINKSQTLFEKVRKLNHIKRCSLFPLINPTSVAEHSFHVAVMSHLYARQIEDLGCPVDVSEVTTKALFHDVEECSISDIPWHIKHHLRKFTNFDEAVNSHTANDLNNYSVEVALRAVESCDGSLEWVIVKICDIAELLVYCKEEYECGNRHLYDMMSNGSRELSRLMNLAAKLIEDRTDHLTLMTINTSPIIKDMFKLLHFTKSFD